MSGRLCDGRCDATGFCVHGCISDPRGEVCDYCSEVLTESECYGESWHCADCKAVGHCPVCNGAPSRG
jgi:hypothetical protein